MNKVAFLSTYPPRECGLATFTEDLVNAISKAGGVEPHIIAVTAGTEEYADPRVSRLVNRNERESYRDAAEWANTHVDLVVIEHEYGIFGGDSGEYVLDLVHNLDIPFIVTLHTVLGAPSTKQLSVLKELGQFSSKVVTMAANSVPVLNETYGIPTEKIEVIHHGVPKMFVESRQKLKTAHNLKNNQVISSFGLLSPDKGIEYGIKAIAKIAADFENVVYFVLGKTHPVVKQKYGESYRQSLADLAESLGVKDNIRFVDKYLTKEEVINYLTMSDIYMTPYLSKEQAVSGTLAYAVGSGRVVVSTPYHYAREMLGDGRGKLAEFRDADSLASCIDYVLRNPLRKREMEKKTLGLGKTMTWDIVANRYTRLFASLTGDLRNEKTADNSLVNELKVYWMPPAELERQLVAQYGNKLGGVQSAELEKANKRRKNFARAYQNEGAATY